MFYIYLDIFLKNVCSTLDYIRYIRDIWVIIIKLKLFMNIYYMLYWLIYNTYIECFLGTHIEYTYITGEWWKKIPLKNHVHLYSLVS